jgi:hypothetical protein
MMNTQRNNFLAQLMNNSSAAAAALGQVKRPPTSAAAPGGSSLFPGSVSALACDFMNSELMHVYSLCTCKCDSD